MRENNGVPTEQDKLKQAHAQAELAKNGDATTADMSGTEKQTPQVTANNNASNEDISPEGLLNVIS